MKSNQVQNGSGARAGHAIRTFVALALLSGVAGTAFAGSEERKGTSGAHELRLPVGPRGTALGPSVVGDVGGVEALFWNPAGLGAIEGTEAMFSHTGYFADMKLNYAAIVTRLGGFGAMGFSAKVLSIGDVIVTTEDAPDGTGEILTPTFTVLGVSWGRQFTDRVLFGGTVHFVSERIQSVGAQGVAFDLGVQYMTGWNGLRFGVAMKSFGPSMRFSGENFNINLRPPETDPTSSNRTFSSNSSQFELPSHFVMGGSIDAVSNADQKLTLLSAFQNNNFAGDNVCGAAEWTYKNTFSLRASYFGTIRQQTDPITGADQTDFARGDDLYEGWAIGAGAQVTTGENRLGVDAAWRGVRNFFDDIYEVALRLSF